MQQWKNNQMGKMSIFYYDQEVHKMQYKLINAYTKIWLLSIWYNPFINFLKGDKIILETLSFNSIKETYLQFF